MARQAGFVWLSRAPISRSQSTQIEKLVGGAHRARLAEARGQSGQAKAEADVAQLAERVLGKDEVTSSILVIGSIRLTLRFASGEPQGSLMASHARQGECPERAKRVEGPQ